MVEQYFDAVLMCFKKHKQTKYFKLLIGFLVCANCTYSSAQQTGAADTISPVIVHNIIITGNQSTKAYIINREVIFHKDDTLNKYTLDAAMERSKENLMNIGLFHSVEMQTFADVNNKVDVHIHVSERWYIFPFPFFELVDRNFNEWWRKRDFSRTNYGIYVSHENFRGRDESLKMQLRLGYSQRLGLFYSIPYINKQQNLGLAFGAFYTRNHEIAYNTINNKLVYVKDEKKYMRKEYYAFVRLSKRKGHNDYYSFFTDYRKNNIADTVVNLNPDYFVNQSNTQQQITLGWSYRHDERDYQTYALIGNMFDLEVLKQGVGIIKNEPQLLTLTSSYRHYWRLRPRWHFASSVRGKLSGQTDAPYFNLRALGYNAEYIRGYEYYVMNGQNYVLFKSNIKFTLVPTKIFTLPLINSGKFNRIPNTFYLNAFFDSGYVRDRQFGSYNFLTNNWQYGYGAGLDYLTYYDLVFRIEYSINRMNERGFFLHFSAPI